MTDDRRWPKLTMSEYHEAEGISSGQLRVCESEGVLAWWSRYVAKRDVREETAAMRMGAVFHAGMENSATWQDGYVRIPDVYEDDKYFASVSDELDRRPGNTVRPSLGDMLKGNSLFRRRYEECWRLDAVYAGKPLLAPAEIEFVERQIAAVWDNTACREYLEQDGHSERSCFWTCPTSGLTVKALADYDLPQLDTFIEFKTTSSPNSYDFMRYEFRKRQFGLDYQNAHYRYVLNRKHSKIITVTGRGNAKEAPACVESMLYDIPFEMIEEQYEKNIIHLKKLAGLLRQVEGSDVDSDGIPHIFHNEYWGAEIDPMELLDGDAALMMRTKGW